MPPSKLLREYFYISFSIALNITILINCHKILIIYFYYCTAEVYITSFEKNLKGNLSMEKRILKTKHKYIEASIKNSISSCFTPFLQNIMMLLTKWRQKEILYIHANDFVILKAKNCFSILRNLVYYPHFWRTYQRK